VPAETEEGGSLALVVELDAWGQMNGVSYKLHLWEAKISKWVNELARGGITRAGRGNRCGEVVPRSASLIIWER